MPINSLKATVDAVQNISLDAFASNKGLVKGLDNGEIRVNGKTFRVTFGLDGQASVKWAHTSFWHLFQGSYRTEVQNKLQDLYNAYRSQRSAGDFEAIRKTFVNITQKTTVATAASDVVRRNFRGQEGSPIVAHYGFDTQRMRGQLGVAVGFNEERRAQNRSGARLHLINDYNSLIGISGENVGIEKCVFTVRRVNEGVDPESVHSDAESGYTKEAVLSWANFIKGHDLDIFTKLERAAADAEGGKTTGWAGVIARKGIEGAAIELVRKNLDGESAQKLETAGLLEGLAKTLVTLSRVDRRTITSAAWSKLVKDTIAENVPKDKCKKAHDLLDSVCATALFRQTSKLGLEFFKSRGVPVLFEWSDHAGRNLGDDSRIGDKWWKDDADPIDRHYGASITFSEMRHVRKMQNRGENSLTGAQFLSVPGYLDESTYANVIDSRRRQFESLSERDLRKLVVELKDGIAERTVESLRPLIEGFLPSLSADHGVVSDKEDGVLRLNNQGMTILAQALKRTKTDYNRLTSDVNRALFLSTFESQLEANFEAIILERGGTSNIEAPEPTQAEKRLETERLFDGAAAGVGRMATQLLAASDNGRGLGRFFFVNGAPTPLGVNIAEQVRREVRNEFAHLEGAARSAYLDDLVETVRAKVAQRVTALATAFARTFGLADAEAALTHPAFKSFFYRDVGDSDSLEKIVASLPVKYRAWEISITARAALEEELKALPDEDRDRVSETARRTLEWDLNRISYDFARDKVEQAEARIAARAKTLVAFARKAHRMADRLGERLNVQLTPEQRRAVVTGYLERDHSAVHGARLSPLPEFDSPDVEADDTAAAGIFESVIKTAVAQGVRSEAVVGGFPAALQGNLKPLLVTHAFTLLGGLQGAAFDVRGMGSNISIVRRFVADLTAAFRPLFGNLDRGKLGMEDFAPMADFCFDCLLAQNPRIKAKLDSLTREEHETLFYELIDEAQDEEDMVKTIVARGIF